MLKNGNKLRVSSCLNLVRMEEDELVQRPMKGRNHLSKRMRPLAFYPKEILELNRLYLLQSRILSIRLRYLNAFGGTYPKELEEIYHQIKYIIEKKRPFPKRASRTPQFTTIEKAFDFLAQDRAKFQYLFVFSPEELKDIVPLLFSENQFVIAHKGACSREEMILLVLFRLSLTASTL